jgi:hypothetical protein
MIVSQRSEWNANDADYANLRGSLIRVHSPHSRLFAFHFQPLALIGKHLPYKPRFLPEIQ